MRDFLKECPSLPVTGAWDSNSSSSVQSAIPARRSFVLSVRKLCCLGQGLVFHGQCSQEFYEDTLIELCYLPGFTGVELPEEWWRQLEQKRGNRPFKTLDDLRAALSALNRT